MKNLQRECVNIVISLLIIYAGIAANVIKYGMNNQVMLVSAIAMFGWTAWLVSFMIRFVRTQQSEIQNHEA
jgi:NAD/NADP transhydrogenase beta subunit